MAIADDVKSYKEIFWLNPSRHGTDSDRTGAALTRADFVDACDRFKQMTPALRQLFPDLDAIGGVRSALIPVPRLQDALFDDPDAVGQLFVKADHDLPVAGSIKARGGIFEVFSHAWDWAVQNGYMTREDPVERLLSPEMKKVFADRVIAVGSTGNLGLSVGIVGRALGFQVEVHMSRDAKAWKKALLRERGATVFEYDDDYTFAVRQAASRAEAQEQTYFVDDEGSRLLFLGYSVAALELKEQLCDLGIEIGATRPLFLYLPCGIGGAPGGIAFGAHQVFGGHAHPFFAEPVASPCMLVEMIKETGGPVSVYDYGLDNVTEADGLAVGTASVLASGLMRPILSGIFTVRDERLMEGLFLLKETEGLRVEPSAAAGVFGPVHLYGSAAGRAYCICNDLAGPMADAVHVIWTTGGRFLPDQDYEAFFREGAIARRKRTGRQKN
ncbi:D-serine ammonia-lyase [Kordiimonas marina]|uniref:D-serine ammonia-lyase n=1 Tax=Kordiimonas marina TaxID=2872312 RepID=UPI001FF31921|nr:D-serine ammonia-lyase [Kordiimonas marina]MCJ9427986.1 D-serine ammonia-lyase [Kordiimonas marina]